MIKKILDLVNSGSRFLVASHEGPDGDALASTLALANFLRENGKDVVAYNVDGVPESFRFLPGSETIVSDLTGVAPFDAGFILDAGELRRAGTHLKDLCTLLVNIDHHPHSEHFGEIHYVDEAASATGTMIYRIVDASGCSLSLDVALCIYTAILSDTGSFRYSNADPEAFRVAAAMVDRGVDPWTVASGLYESQSEKRLRLLARALATLTISPCGLYGSVSVTREMMDQCGAGPEDTDGFVNYPRSVYGVEVSLFFRQTGTDTFKVGFRSKGRIDVGLLARELGGGGHHNASGAMVQGTIDQVRNTVFTRLDELLN